MLRDMRTAIIYVHIVHYYPWEILNIMHTHIHIYTYKHNYTHTHIQDVPITFTKRILRSCDLN